jgi:hypothetical protein
MLVVVLTLMGSFDSAGRALCAQPAPLRMTMLISTTTGYIPGMPFMLARRRMKLGLPICLNIFFICAYWRSRLLTS